MKRRTFVKTGLGLSMASSLLAIPGCTNKKDVMKELFIHHVYFWLKDPSDPAAVTKFEAALRKLVTIGSIHQAYLGKPASTRRDVIDSSYQYSLLTMFKDEAAHDDYQVHSLHDEFRVVAGELCSKVLVYDSVQME
jgi:hypothetical protein